VNYISHKSRQNNMFYLFLHFYLLLYTDVICIKANNTNKNMTRRNMISRNAIQKNVVGDILRI